MKLPRVPIAALSVLAAVVLLGSPASAQYARAKQVRYGYSPRVTIQYRSSPRARFGRGCVIRSRSYRCTYSYPRTYYGSGRYYAPRYRFCR